MNATRVLITSAGGLTGVYLTRYYKKLGYFVITTDMSDFSPSAFFADKHYVIPNNSTPGFLKIIKNIIADEKIEILVPTTSFDMDYYSNCDVKSALKPCKYITMNPDDIKFFNNKKKWYLHFNQIGIDTPMIYKTKDEMIYPCFIKPCVGTGSKNSYLLENEQDYDYYIGKLSDEFIICEYLEGKEYTVDCFFNANGDCVGYSTRERIKTNGGGVVITQIQNSLSKYINDVIVKLEAEKVFVGPVNFQFKLSSEQKPVIFDLNTRFASGGLPASVESGFDIPGLYIKLCNNETIPKQSISIQNDGLVMIRHYTEVYKRG
jgi:carbamoyl-phosphate synthase large subunit